MQMTLRFVLTAALLFMAQVRKADLTGDIDDMKVNIMVFTEEAEPSQAWSSA
jgi:hypothetical protein